MSYKFDSLVIILNKIDSGAGVTVQSLMNQLEVTDRTVYRYIETLKTAGYPIIFDQQKKSYVFAENYHLKKPNLSKEEQLALALAKKMLITVDAGMIKYLDLIEEKVKSEHQDVEKFFITDRQFDSQVKNSHLTDIYIAIQNNRRLEIITRNKNDKSTKEKIDPYYIFCRDGLWYLRVYSHDEESFDSVPLNSICQLQMLDEYFLPKIKNPEEEVYSSFGSWLDDEDFEDIVLRFDPVIISAVREKKWHQSQEETLLEDGRLEIKIRTKGSIQMMSWIFQWIPWVEVIAPVEMQIMVYVALHAALDKYK